MLGYGRLFVCRPAVGTVSNICHKLFCGRKPAIDPDVEAARALNGALPGSDPAEASRRRYRHHYRDARVSTDLNVVLMGIAPVDKRD